jgi:uncharacterized protein YkwD
VSQRRETMVIDDLSGDRPSRSGHRSMADGLRSADPITMALVVGGVLAVVGISLAVLAPVVSGSPSADSMPAGTVVTASASAVPAAAAGPTASTQASPNAPVRTSAPAPTPTDRFRPDALEDQVVKLTNDARRQAHCKDVRTNSRLHAIARTHSGDMAATSTFSSTGSDGSNYAQRAARAGVKDPLGENIARGQATAQDVVSYWLSHGTTRAHLLDCAATAVGVGVARAADGTYFWTQDLSK